MSQSSTLPDWFARAVAALQAGDIAGWMEMYAGDAVHEFPFAPAGAPVRLDGKAAIAAYMHQLPGLVRFGELSDLRVHQAADEWIVEATGHLRRVADDSPAELGYIWFVRLEQGKVRHFRDYMNPTQLAALLNAPAA